jgi:predicted nucleic acid-binding protein
VIVVDTTILVYAVSTPSHPLVGPSQRLVRAITEAAVHATTTPDVIHEFVHVRTRLRDRSSAIELGRRFARLLAPLLTTGELELEAGLTLYERHRNLGAFDALLAATAIAADADAFVSADRAFAQVRRLRHIDPSTPALDELIPSA